MFIAGTSKLSEEICNALGFKDVVSLQLSIEPKDAISVTVKKYVTVEEAKALALVLSRFDIKATQVRWAGKDIEEYY